MFPRRVQLPSSSIPIPWPRIRALRPYFLTSKKWRTDRPEPLLISVTHVKHATKLPIKTASSKSEFKCSLKGDEPVFDISAFLEARRILKPYRPNILDHFAVAGMVGFCRRPMLLSLARIAKLTKPRGSIPRCVSRQHTKLLWISFRHFLDLAVQLRKTRLIAFWREFLCAYWPRLSETPQQIGIII